MSYIRLKANEGEYSPPEVVRYLLYVEHELNQTLGKRGLKHKMDRMLSDLNIFGVAEFHYDYFNMRKGE